MRIKNLYSNISLLSVEYQAQIINKFIFNKLIILFST